MSSNGLLARYGHVLSIGKVGLGRGQQLYYEQQVARGAEDYYAGRGEVPGRWVGSGAAVLGLEGELDSDQLTALMDGKHPASGAQLAQRTARSSTAGFDVTFSAPKSISVLFAVGDPEVSSALVEAHDEAHDEAVDAAVAYLELEACRVRRGHNGTTPQRERGNPRGWQRARSERASGFVAAAYRHRMSRAQDPQLHTHLVAANMAQGLDGRWTALDARHLYQHAKAAGSIYQAHLRAAVRGRVPWASWGPVRNGMAELEQVPEAVLGEFSTRRRRILEREEALVAAGVAVGDSGRERIAYDTREAKRSVDERDWRIEVRARAAEHGFGRDELEQLAGFARRRGLEIVDEDGLAAELFGPVGLTARANSFGLSDVVAAVAAAAGQGLDGWSVQRLACRLLESPEVVRLAGEPAARFTTGELLEAERRVVALATEGRDADAALVGEIDVLKALSGHGRRLSDEQERVVIRTAGSGNRIDTVEALAGTGKTTCAAALRAVYEQAGYRVIGAAPTGRATRELKEQARISESRTLDGWLVKLTHDPLALARDPWAQSSAGTVLILDEAGMAGTRLTARLLDAAVEADVKVVAFGDSGQLASVGAGGWLGALTRQLGSFELREVMRQRDPTERRALTRVHRGEPEHYLDLKAQRNELTLFAGEHARAEAERAAVEQILSARESFGPDQAVLICRENDRRERLNRLVRERLKERGELGEGIDIAGREFSPGDRVIARRNDRARDLDNGTRGTVIDVDARNGLRVRTDSGATRQVDVEYASRHLEHAYALTGHGMQGATVEWAAAIGRPGDFTRNWSYTALSRAREPTLILLVDEPTQAQLERAAIAPGADISGASDPVRRMAVRMRERDDEDLALEQLDRTELAEQPPRERAADAHEADVTRLHGLTEQLDQVRRQLAALPLREVSSLDRTEATIEHLTDYHARLSRQRGWRNRKERRYERENIERRLEYEHFVRGRLLEVIDDPAAVSAQAERLREEQEQLSTERWELRHRLIEQEIEHRPRWLENALGHEPDDRDLGDHWRNTARDLAAHRLDHAITDPERALGPKPDRFAAEQLIEARVELGLERERPDRDQGLDIGW